MAQRGNTINPTNPIALVPANDRGPLRPFTDDYSAEPVYGTVIANFCSLMASHCADKYARQCWLIAAGAAWDGVNRLRSLEPKAVAHV